MASVLCLASSFYAMSAGPWLVLAVGLATTPFLSDHLRQQVQRYSDFALWPIVLLALYALIRLSPDAAKGFSILVGALLIQANLRARSDQDAVALLAPFGALMAFGFVSSESLWTSMASMAGTICLLLALSCANDGAAPQKTWRHAWRIAKVVVMAIPWIVALFFLFPRIPFNTLPEQRDDPSSGSTGLSDSMAPGSISDLVQSSTPAFTAKFSNRIPEKSQLYWRATVFDQFDGARWVSTMGNAVSLGAGRQAHGVESRPFALTRYELSFASDLMRFLPIPDGTMGNRVSMPLKSGDTVALSPNPFGVYQSPGRGISAGTVNATMQVDDTGVMEDNARTPAALFLQLPEGKNPRTLQLAKKMAQDANQVPQAIVEGFRERISKQNYWYSLKPPLLGSDGVDQFLFETQKGFCEHYASAFVIFMRMAGVPARVVTGYQGGDVDPLTKTVNVVSRDAHAWAEILTEGKWKRVDPTSFIDPSRIEPGAANPGASWTFLGNFGKEFRAWTFKLTMQWNEKVVAYDAGTQQGLLEKLGVPSRFKHLFFLAVLGAIGMLFFLIAMARQAFRSKARPSSAQRRFQALRRALKQQGIIASPHDTVLTLCANIQARMDASSIDTRLGVALQKELMAHNRQRYARP